MNKAYTRINFQNTPSTATPLNATNMNKIDKAINDIDDRVIELAGYQEEAQESAEMASASASAAAKAAETAASDAEARVNEVIQGLEVYTKEDSQKKFASVIKQTVTGSPILITDSADGTLIDFKAYGRSTQNGTPTPDSPIAIKSVADGGWFDGELVQGTYAADGTITHNDYYVSAKNFIPCKAGDIVKLAYKEKVYNLFIQFFDDTKRLSTVNLENTSEIVATTPSGATRFGITIVNTNGITPTNAKKIVITINDKYALIVKSGGKNFLSHTTPTQTINGVTWTRNKNGSFTANGTATENSVLYLCSSSNMLKVPSSSQQLIYSGVKGGSSTTYFMQIWRSSSWIPYIDVVNGVQQTNVSTEDYELIIGLVIKKGITVNNVVFEPMIRPVGTDDTYEPYKEEVKYIPLNEPLRSSLDGSVTDVASLGKCEVTRRIIKKRITQVSKNNSTNANNYCYYAILENVGKSGVGLSNTLSGVSLSEVTSDGTDNIGMYVTSLYDGVVYINVGKHLTENTVEGMTKWLSENPTYIQYELAEPIVETIEPVDIVTYDNVTYLTASDNAEMEVTYATDTKTYIDNKFAELQAAILATGANV